MRKQNLARIQNIVDVLDSIVDPVSHCNQLEADLDGLPDDYSALAFIIQSCVVMRPIIELESMLPLHESKLDKMKKFVLSEPLLVSITKGTISASDAALQPISAPNSAPQQWNGSQFTGNRANRGGCTFNRGRGG